LVEKDTLVDLLTLIDKSREKHSAAFTQWREGDHTLAGTAPVPSWVCREIDKKSFRMFLRMFLPKHGYGCLGKTPALQWAAIRDKICLNVDLTENAFNAKEEALRRRLKAVEQSIQDSQTVQGDEEPTAMNT
jgi:hypothetical protein